MDRNDNGLFFTATDEDYKLARSLGLTIEDIRECRQAEARRAFEATLAPKHSKLPGCSTNAHIDSSPASQLDEKDEKEEKELVELSRVLDIPVQVLREGRAAEKERQAAEDFNQRYNKQKASQTVIKGRVIDEDYDADDHLVGEGTKRVKKAKTKNYRRPAGPRNPATSFNTRGLSIIPEEDIEEGEPEEGYDLYKVYLSCTSITAFNTLTSFHIDLCTSAGAAPADARRYQGGASPEWTEDHSSDEKSRVHI